MCGAAVFKILFGGLPKALMSIARNPVRRLSASSCIHMSHNIAFEIGPVWALLAQGIIGRIWPWQKYLLAIASSDPQALGYATASPVSRPDSQTRLFHTNSPFDFCTGLRKGGTGLDLLPAEEFSIPSIKSLCLASSSASA